MANAWLRQQTAKNVAGSCYKKTFHNKCFVRREVNNEIDILAGNQKF